MVRERDVEGHGRFTLAVERSRELLEVERVAAALLVQRVRVDEVDRVAQQLASLGLREGVELDADQRAGTLRPLERGQEPLRLLARAERDRDEHARRRRTAHEGAE